MRRGTARTATARRRRRTEAALIAASGFFDPAWYAPEHADELAEAFGAGRASDQELLAHFLDHGSAAGWSPSPAFDTAWYLAVNEDVAASGALALVHFLRHGRAEGRPPVPGFDLARFHREHPELAGDPVALARHLHEPTGGATPRSGGVLLVGEVTTESPAGRRLAAAAAALGRLGYPARIVSGPAFGPAHVAPGTTLVSLWPSAIDAWTRDVVLVAQGRRVPVHLDVVDPATAAELAAIAGVLPDVLSGSTREVVGRLRRLGRPAHLVVDTFDEAAWVAADLARRIEAAGSSAPTPCEDDLVRSGPRRAEADLAALLAAVAAAAPAGSVPLPGAREASAALVRDRLLDAAGPLARPAVRPHVVVASWDRREPVVASVVVPLHDYASVVGEALDSVAAQSLDGVELVVVDDASSDDSLDVARRWLEDFHDRFARATLVRLEQNSGLSAARNLGFRVARALYVLPLDADNVLLPDCLAELVAAARTTSASAVYPRIERFGDGEAVGEEMGVPGWAPMLLAGGNYIDAMALVTREAWLAVGGYDETLRSGLEDFDFWCRLVEAGRFAQPLPSVLARYRVHPGSMLHRTERTGEAAVARAQLMDRHPWLTLVLESEGPDRLPADDPSPTV